jgi:uncharacterized protein YneF (UPF0154 family)
VPTSPRPPAWFLFVVLPLTALGALAISVALLDGSELYFLGLAALSAGVFVAAYFISSRQIEAALREEAIVAKNQIKALKAQIAELKEALKKANQAQSAHVQALEAKIEALQSIIDDFNKTAGPGIMLRSVAAETQAVEDAGSAVAPAQDELNAATAGVEEGATGLLSSITKLASELPEKHRLAGVWVTAGAAIAVLAFLTIADVSISTSDSGDQGTQESTLGAGNNNQQMRPLPTPPWRPDHRRGPRG